jgi:hypothetical protein
MHNFSARLWSTLCTNSRRTAHPPWPTTHANALGSWCFGPSLAGAATTVAQQHRSVGRKKRNPIAPHVEFLCSDRFSEFSAEVELYRNLTWSRHRWRCARRQGGGGQGFRHQGGPGRKRRPQGGSPHDFLARGVPVLFAQENRAQVRAEMTSLVTAHVSLAEGCSRPSWRSWSLKGKGGPIWG